MCTNSATFSRIRALFLNFQIREGKTFLLSPPSCAPGFNKVETIYKYAILEIITG